MATPIFDLQPMSIGDILDRTVRLYRRGFLHNIAIVAVPYILVIPGAVLFGSALYFQGDPRMLLRPGLIGTIGILVLAFVWLYFMSMGALARSISERYLGETPTVAGCYGVVLRRSFSLIWAYILASLVWGGLAILMAVVVPITMFISPIVTGVGVVVLFVVLVVAFLRFLLITQIIVIEDVRGVASLQRSWALMRGNFWRAIVILVFSIVVSFVLSFVLNFPGGILSELIGGPVGAVIRQVFSQLSQILVSPIFDIAITLLYYDSRIRNEAFDLQIMAQNLGVPSGGAGTPPAPWEAEPLLVEEPLSPSAASPRPAPVPRPSVPSTPPPRRPAPTAAPQRPAGAPSPRPSASPFKTCPKCKAQVPAIKPICPKCGARVPYRSVH